MARVRVLGAGCTLAAILAPTGCASPGHGAVVDERRAVQGIELATGERLQRVVQSRLLGNVPNLESSFAGGASGHSVSVLIFDTPLATGQVATRPVSQVANTRVVRRRNVVIFVSGREAGVAAIERAIDAAVR